MRNRFKVGAGALHDASTSVHRDVVQVVWQHGRDAAAAIPTLVLSVGEFNKCKKESQHTLNGSQATPRAAC